MATLRSWTQALALAPMVLGAVACSGTDSANDAGGAADASVFPDAMMVANDASIADAGLADAEVRDADPVDMGVVADAGEADSGTPDAGNGNCTYPAGAVEPMALNEVITAHSWPTAIDGANQRFELDLTQAFCNDDPDIDWSPFDVLLFVSVPAW